MLGRFASDAAIAAAGRALPWVGALVEPGRTFNLVVTGALRATGDVRFPVMAAVASMAPVLAPVSLVLGIHFGLGLPSTSRSRRPNRSAA